MIRRFLFPLFVVLAMGTLAISLMAVSSPTLAEEPAAATLCIKCFQLASKTPTRRVLKLPTQPVLVIKTKTPTPKLKIPVRPSRTPTTPVTEVPPATWTATIPPVSTLPYTPVPPTNVPVQTACLPNAIIVMQRNYPVTGNSDIVLYNPITKTEVNLTAAFPGRNTHPSVAPDACQVVFAHANNPTDNTDLFTMPIAGGVAQSLTNTPAISETQPVWSRLGSIVYAVPGGNLFATNALGNVNVDLGVKGETPQISPDGQWILFNRTDSPTKTISVVSILGRANGFFDLKVQGTDPHWNANGQNIYMQVNGSIVNFEFGKPQNLLTAGATNISTNPGGDGAVLVIADQLWLVPTLNPLGLPQPLTQGGADNLTNSAPEWWDPTPMSTNMNPFMQYLAQVGPAA